MITPSVAEVFGESRRFHVYDHAAEEWAATGLDVGGGGCVYRDARSGETVSADDPGDVADGDDLTLVWEDGPDAEYERTAVSLDTAQEAASVISADVAASLGVDETRVMVASLEPPNRVSYMLRPEPVEAERADNDA